MNINGNLCCFLTFVVSILWIDMFMTIVSFISTEYLIIMLLFIFLNRCVSGGVFQKSEELLEILWFPHWVPGHRLLPSYCKAIYLSFFINQYVESHILMNNHNNLNTYVYICYVWKKCKWNVWSVICHSELPSREKGEIRFSPLTKALLQTSLGTSILLTNKTLKKAKRQHITPSEVRLHNDCWPTKDGKFE